MHVAPDHRVSRSRFSRCLNYLHRGLTTDNPVEYGRDIPLNETLL